MSVPVPLPDPRLLAATRGLALTARHLVAGALAGLHPSRRTGQAREFSQYRAYQPGDEPRLIDWKLFARSDRFFLRESDVDTRVAFHVILDATGSMAHCGDDPAVPTKFTAARNIAAAIAWLAEAQGDPFLLHVVADGQVRTVITAGGRQPFRHGVHALAALAPAGRWPDEKMAVTRALQRAEQTGSSTGPGTTARITLLLTDGHEPGGEIRAALAPLRARAHELIFCQFISPDERRFPYRGAVRFEEWETGRTLEADASTVGPAFELAAARERTAWSRAWGGDRFDYLALYTDEPLDRALREFLRRRQRH